MLTCNKGGEVVELDYGPTFVGCRGPVQHVPPSIKQCDVCKRQFINERYLNEHVQDKHDTNTKNDTDLPRVRPTPKRARGDGVTRLLESVAKF